MAEAIAGLTGMGHAARILAALEGGLHVQQRVSKAKCRSSQDVEEAVAELNASSAWLNKDAVEKAAADAPVAALSRASAKLLEDVAAQIATLPTEGQTSRSMLDQLNLNQDPSRAELSSMREAKARLKEQVAKLDELVSLSLQCVLW